MDKIREGIRTKGLEFLFETIKSDDGFKKLSTAKVDKEFEDIVSRAVISAGKEALSLDGLKSHYILHVLGLLKDTEFSKRMLTLILTDTGRNILRKAAETPEGEFLLFGVMSANYPLAHSFVNQVLKSREGRALIIHIVDSACHFTPSEQPKLPAFEVTPKGNELRSRLSSDTEADKFIVLLRSQQYSDQLASYMADNSSEAASIFMETLSSSAGVKRIVKIATSEAGKNLCALLGKNGFGRKIGANYLWLIPQGRNLVHELFKTNDGPYVVYALATGMTVAEFIAYTVS